jgi:hypothetical protein
MTKEWLVDTSARGCKKVSDLDRFSNREDAIARLPQKLHELAKEFPPGSHFHLSADRGVYFPDPLYLWGYSENARDLMLSTLEPTERSILLDPKDHVFPLAVDLLRELGAVPCGNLVSGFRPEGDDNDIPDWALPG